ncbi:MAG: hypothetical protein V1739_07995 [Candidatus Omnitrophota bacterium]
MNLENVSTILGLLGLGGILGTYFRILWERRNSALLQKQDYKEVRYKCIIILAMALLDFEKNKFLLHQNNREYIKTPKDLIGELKIEWNNMILFASDEVLTAMHEFINDHSQNTFRKFALAMRKDLWGGKISLKNLEKLKNL